MRFSYPHLSIIIIIVVLPTVILGRHVAQRRSTSGHTLGLERQTVVGQKEKMRLVKREVSTQLVAGSSLPNCSHACGSCSPCRLVMVSFICEAEAETCPMAYKCMCNSKSYPVP